jgi:hypothetical protein
MSELFDSIRTSGTVIPEGVLQAPVTVVPFRHTVNFTDPPNLGANPFASKVPTVRLPTCVAGGGATS